MTSPRRTLRHRDRAARAAVFLLAPLLAMPLALAHAGESAPLPAYPEGSTFARIRVLEGGVTVLHGTEVIDDHALSNTPLAAGDTVETGQDGFLEIQMADGSLVWLDRSTRTHLVALRDQAGRYENRTLLGMDYGVMSIQVADPGTDDLEFRVDTDAGLLYFLEPGLYKIEVGASGLTRIVTRGGMAEVAAGGQSILVDSGESTVVAPGRAAEPPRAASTRAADPFDASVDARREAEEDELRALSPQAIAVEEDLPPVILPYVAELDPYGSWHDDPRFGPVWVPAVPAGWRPYAAGSWFPGPYGWAWVSSEPWGYAPAHYGRWEFIVGFGWSWIPGAVYAPAWVSWAYADGFVGWCPMGWYDGPTGWSLQIHFGTFHGPYWSFVSYSNFGHRHLDAVIAREHVVSRDVVFARRPPAIQPARGRHSHDDRLFRRGREDALRDRGPQRASSPAAPRSFRERERRMFGGMAPRSRPRRPLQMASAETPRHDQEKTSGKQPAGGHTRERRPHPPARATKPPSSTASRPAKTTRRVPTPAARRILGQTRTRRSSRETLRPPSRSSTRRAAPQGRRPPESAARKPPARARRAAPQGRRPPESAARKP
ncbi:MAG: DUF6600 domain-containing protein, partial [Acidobacteriota bacterium]